VSRPLGSEPLVDAWRRRSAGQEANSDILRAMSGENVEILRRALPDSAPPNVEALFAILDENVEWDYVGAFPETVTYRGPQEVREFLGQWAEGFDDFGFEAEEAIDAGDSVVVHLHQWGRGKETGAPVESRTWQVFTFLDGKVIRCRGYATKAEAFESAGLRA
jgi:ketosteroid isomerase-like protein